MTTKRGSRLVLLAACLAASLLVGAPAGQSRGSANLTLYVYFGYNNEISVRLADGTPVGTLNGTPTVIPAGYYTLSFQQPGCVQVPSFELQGPGVSVVDNLSGGEVTSATDPVNFQPSSTYTWRNDANRSLTYTFATSSAIVGTQPGVVVHPALTSSNGASSNSDIVGSDVHSVQGHADGLGQRVREAHARLQGEERDPACGRSIPVRPHRQEQGGGLRGRARQSNA